MRQSRILGSVVVLLAAAAVPVVAQRTAQSSQPSMATRGVGMMGGRHGACRGLMEALALTPEQGAALETLRQQTRTSTLPVAEQFHELHETMEQNLKSASPDRCAIGDLVIQAHGLHDQIEASLKASAESFIAGLTAQQRASYDAFIQANPECSAAALFGPHAGRPHGRMR